MAKLVDAIDLGSIGRKLLEVRFLFRPPHIFKEFMTNDYDIIEEELKEEEQSQKKTHKISGRSVFKLKEIIKDKAEDLEKIDNENRN